MMPILNFHTFALGFVERLWFRFNFVFLSHVKLEIKSNQNKSESGLEEVIDWTTQVTHVNKISL